MDDMQQWWNDCHKTPGSYYISNYGGPELWQRLRVDGLVAQGVPVLEIGVGGGTNIVQLHEKGMEVHVVDITPTAFERVAGHYHKAWLEPELESLPENYFRFAISHLVTQHIDNRTLTRQISLVLRSLQPDGLFAMQFSDGIPPIKARRYTETLETKQIGDVRRTPRMMKELVKQSGGTITWISESYPYPDEYKQWYYIHIERAKKSSLGFFHRFLSRGQ